MAACKKDRFPHVKGSLRIEKHIRGHVASCNAPLERVKVKVRSHGEDNEDPRVKLTRLAALMVEAQLHEKSQQESDKLKRFQKSVRQRLIEKSRNHDRESIKPVVINHKMACNTGDDIVTDSSIDDTVCTTPTDNIVPLSRRRHNKYCFVPEDKVKMAQRQQHAEQNLAIRRMYSAIERQQSRLITHRRQLQMEMRVVRDEREQRRRDMETRYITELNDSSDSEEYDRRERGQEWMEMIALERRHQKLLKQKEIDRYCKALQHQLYLKHPTLPSFCTCHTSLWESDPSLCATNCPYYLNHSKFSTALSSLLQSLS